MGACLDLLTETAPFAQEARSESFYIGTVEPVMHAHKGVDGAGAIFSVSTEHIAAFRAGLEQVHEFSDIADRAAAAGVSLDPWTVDVVDSEVIVQGPAYAYTYGAGTSWAPCETVEIEYAHLNHLRAALAAVAGA